MSPNGEKRVVTFDLLRQPFSILRVEPTATMAEISEAFEDASRDGLAPESELSAARQAIINPRLRLAAELAALLDTPAGEAKAVYSALRSGASSNDLRRVADRLSPLSRCNLLTHIAAHHPADADLLVALVDAHSSMAAETLAPTIERVRKAAGSVSPSLDALSAGLHDLIARHSKAVFEGFLTIQSAAAPVYACTTRVLASPNPDRIEALDSIIRAYGQFIGPELSRYEERVKAACDSLRTQPTKAYAVASIAEAVRSWHVLGASLMELEAHKGRDDKRARELFAEVRSLAVDLANDHQQYDSGLSLTKAALEAFSALPRAAEQLKEDFSLLEERAAAAGVEPLKKWIDDLGGDLVILADDLQAHGFGDRSIRETKELFDLFLRAIDATQSTKASDLPWILARGLAIRLNNEGKAPRAALALTTGLLQRTEASSVSTEMLNQLRGDQRTIERNLLEEKLMEHIKANRVSDALAVISNLLNDYKSPEERDLLRGVEAGLQKKRTAQITRWVVFGVIGAIILIANLGDKSSPPPSTYAQRPVPSSPSYQPPSVQGDYRSPPATTPPSAHSAEEVMPEVGYGQKFSRGNIRYCLYQEERMRSIKSSLSINEDIDAFNKLVNDWNLRCSNYKYLESDMAAVTAELSEKKPKLEKDGKQIVAGWPSRSVPVPGNTYIPPPSPQSDTAPVLWSPTPPEQQAEITLDLLRIEDAVRVQNRLRELGYFRFQGLANGTWGAQSRRALRAFKLANGLTSDDVLDSMAAGRLFSASAVRAEAKTQLGGAQTTVETAYPAPYGATLNPLNRADAVRIHAKFRELALYKGKDDTVWSGASRVALTKFKTKYGLGQDDVWDAATEQRLFSLVPDRPAENPRDAFSAAVAGTWVTDIRACPGGEGGTDAVPISITAVRAEAGGGGCEFGDMNGAGATWTVKAVCSFNGKSWTANINLTRAGELLTWSSERGLVQYRRCGS
ncbi:MAG TPA: peptidoglycan-binding domain-containing protein [Methylocella sp.]